MVRTSGHAKHAVLVTVGTLGDLVPFLTIGRLLGAEGYAVTLLTNVNWRDLAERNGFGFVPIAEREPPQNERKDRSFFTEKIIPAYQASHDHILRRVADTDIVLYRVGMNGAAAACRKRGLRSVKVFLQPGAVPTLLAPAWPLGEYVARIRSERTRAFVLRWLLRLNFRTSLHSRLTRRFMRKVGVAHTMASIVGDDTPAVHLFPRWFGRPAPDWPTRAVFTGFLFEPRDLLAHMAGAGDAARRFRWLVEAKGAPIVFTSGTGYVEDKVSIEVAKDLCARSGSPGVFISRKTAQAAGDLESDDFIVVDHLDLMDALPHARCLIHHGGIGTLSKALHAGIPQIIRPFSYDQPDNAWRVMTAGVGAGVAMSVFTVETLMSALAVVETPEVRARIRIASDDVRRSDAQAALLAFVKEVADETLAAGGAATP